MMFMHTLFVVAIIFQEKIWVLFPIAFQRFSVRLALDKTNCIFFSKHKNYYSGFFIQLYSLWHYHYYVVFRKMTWTAWKDKTCHWYLWWGPHANSPKICLFTVSKFLSDRNTIMKIIPKQLCVKHYVCFNENW